MKGNFVVAPSLADDKLSRIARKNKRRLIDPSLRRRILRLDSLRMIAK